MSPERRRRTWVRVALYVSIIAVLIVWQWWGGRSTSVIGPDGNSSEGSNTEAWPDHLAYVHRAATVAEWLQPIATLGEQKRARLQPWIGINGWNQAQGELVWWHDGTAPRVAYLAAPGEMAEHAGPTLFIAIAKGQAVLFGDPGFANNFGEWSPSYALPADWVVLTAPQSSIGSTDE